MHFRAFCDVILLYFGGVEASLMAYHDWTLETVKKAFQLEETNAAGIFGEVDPVEPSTHLATTLARNVPLAFAMGTEKAKSVSSPVW